MDRKEKSALHKGHRTRLKQRYVKSGIESFQEHEILEMLLFFGIPFKDTNELAHELINEFGSLHNVLNAHPENLKKHKNMTGNSVILLKLVSDICKNNSLNQKSQPKKIKNIDDIKNLLKTKYYGIDREIVSLILLDNRNKFIDCMTLCEGSEYTSEVALGDIARIANTRNVSRIMLAHNHPNNTGVSSDDVIATRKTYLYLKGINIELCQNFVVTNNHVFCVNDVIDELEKKKSKLKI